MNGTRSIRLALFFSKGVSLKTWEHYGLLERELALYRSLQSCLGGITFVSYGDRSEGSYQALIPGIEILHNRWGLPTNLYARLIPFLHAPSLRRASVFKTNQTNGAEIALAAARLHRKRLIARCGYMWSDFAARGGAGRLAEAERARRVECRVFNGAHKVVVTTPAMRDYAMHHYQLPQAKMQIIPNYVLTDLFCPDGTSPISNRLCFVGRLEEQKNLVALVEACAGLDVELVVAGDGPLRRPLAEMAEHLQVKLRLLGNLPHVELPKVLRESSVFLLVSSHEGHPKSLIEAMACGLPAIGADSPGIRELIRHGETGFLCGTDPSSIRTAIQTVLADDSLRRRMGQNARQYVLENFALEKVVSMELEVLNRVSQDTPL